MLRAVFIFLTLTSIIPAQYSVEDSALVRSTFTQTFDKSIIYDYLYSKDNRKIKAALLSISQSRDTSFIPIITSLDFDTYGNYIAFALGQLGESIISTKYLSGRLNVQNTPFRKMLYEALGKTGTSETFGHLLKEYNEGLKTDGIALAIANFAFRNIIDSSGKVFTILSKEFFNKNTNIKRRIDALFTTSRLTVPNSLLSDLNELLKERPEGEDGIHFLQYTLAAIRKSGSTPADASMIKQLLHHKDWRIRTEAVKVLCLMLFEMKEDLDEYLKLLKDQNPNVSRQTAVSVRSIKLTDKNETFLRDELKKYLSQTNLKINTLGELFISFVTLFPDELHSTIVDLESRLDRNFIYNALEQNAVSPQKNLELLYRYKPDDYLEHINYFSALLPLSGLENVGNELMKNLQNSIPPVVSIIAEGVDSNFIQKHVTQLKGLIIHSIKNNLNKPDHSEALISLVNLSGKIDTSFQKEVLKQLRNSSIFSVAKYSSSLLNISPPLKDSSNFSNVWDYSFKHKTAKIITNKGAFTIQFYPQYAPISVGNFCYLAEKEYFKNNKFHRVVPNFVIQTGDPQGTGWGGPGYEIISEFSPLDYRTGTLGMASAGKDTEGSQWFVTHSYFPHLNGRYTIFGTVIHGMDVVNNIDQGDEIVKIELNK